MNVCAKLWRLLLSRHLVVKIYIIKAEKIFKDKSLRKDAHFFLFSSRKPNKSYCKILKLRKKN